MKATNIIALDVGQKRIGVAIANSSAGFPSPLMTLINDEKIWEELKDLIAREDVGNIVVGLPRNLSGEETDQTRITQKFINELKEHTNLPIVTQDEALTSVKAEQELTDKKQTYNKAEVDALAATYILEDYLADIRVT